ncbi:hypothetical protein EPI10_016115 [Gossypium australe]|uniref:Uncharacterized protein n=1 Tax=Gossypium australe TaxID=47621 RepID=A0A5B6VMS4_9ROSI|nr:hypothetical protein EPI10_016115 [Gossypium australe]
MWHLSSFSEGPCEGIANDNTTDADGSLEVSFLVTGWRDEGSFTGIGPRVSRAGPSVGIVSRFSVTCGYRYLGLQMDQAG